MSRNNSKHGGNASPAEIMMYGRHRAGGGSTTSSDSSMPSNIPNFGNGGAASYKHGGRPKSYMRSGRACHAEGDSVLPSEKATNPITGHKYGQGPTSYSESVTETKLSRGGPARHAEGDSVKETVPYKRGGPTRRRERHGLGDIVGKLGGIASTLLPLLPMVLKNGGPARRRRHKEGDMAK